jgi:hypothetical protein
MTDTLSADVDGLFPIDEQQTDQQPDPQPAPVVTEEQVEQKPADAPQEQKLEEVQKPEEDKQPHVVPLATFLDKRDEAKELKRKLAEAEQRIQTFQKPQAPPRIPDPYEQPEEYTAFMQAQVEDQAYRLRLDMSGQFAEQQHGKEKVEAAVTWAQEQGQVDPTFGIRLRGQQNPVGWVVDQYNREMFFNQYGSDPSALQAQAQASQGQIAPQNVAQAAPQRQAPPRSLVGAPSTGAGHQTIPTGSVLDSVKFNLD